MAGYPDMHKIPREPSNIIVRLPTNIVSSSTPNNAAAVTATTPTVKPAVATPQQSSQVQQENIVDLDFGEMISAPPISSPVSATATPTSKPIADLGDLFASVRIENRNHGNDEWPTNTGVSSASLFPNAPTTNDFTKSASFESFTKPSTDQFADFLFSSGGVSSNNDKGSNGSSKSRVPETHSFGYLQSDLNNIGSVSTSTPMPMLSSSTIGFTSHSHSTGSDSELLRFSNSTSNNTNNFFPIPELPQKNLTFGLDSTSGPNNIQHSDSKNSSGFALDFGQFKPTSEVIPSSQFPAFNQNNSLPVINNSSKNGQPGDDKDFILSLYNK